MQAYHRKLYALLHRAGIASSSVPCLQNSIEDLEKWWEMWEEPVSAIARASDQAVFKPDPTDSDEVQIRHLISGQDSNVQKSADPPEIPQQLLSNDVEQTFWRIWRFYPEQSSPLYPANLALPDCSQHSYNSTLSALVGAMFPDDWKMDQNPVHPYLILFNFSPVQEFIKASRKFLDYWAGSYMLHYLSAIACWFIAERYGPDAVITPSLWGQEIIDAFLVKKYSNLESVFKGYSGGTPAKKFTQKTSNSLNTAGFPNLITALVPGRVAAKQLGTDLSEHLKKEWNEIGTEVRKTIKKQVMALLETSEQRERILSKLYPESSSRELTDRDRQEREDCKRDLEKWSQQGCWEWNKLWEAQLNHSWETYWTTMPLGDPEQPLTTKASNSGFPDDWSDAQNTIAQIRTVEQKIPAAAEKKVLAQSSINVGSWWGNLQSRLGRSLPAVKNTRNWQIPVTPGERSTLSGQFSAVHPMLHYKDEFRQGGGLSAGTMRLFWNVMAEAFPGLFDGSEKLNALELTKRMAWVYGGVAEQLGIKTEGTDQDYEAMIRFPNLSSIAAARFAHDHPEKLRAYHSTLWQHLKQADSLDSPQGSLEDCKDAFQRKTRRPFQVTKTDAAIFPKSASQENLLNGSMFSSKWLAEDMGIQDRDRIFELKSLVSQAHKDCGFGNSSPADWWAIVLADGDNMGKYVSGRKLKPYKTYLNEAAICDESKAVEGFDDFISQTPKRMGPATHVGLNRALLDFSNRLVPALTERRFCGRVIYSGGDDVMAVLPIEDLPAYLNSLRAAWSGSCDPYKEFQPKGGYWLPRPEAVKQLNLSDRPYFTMGEKATMSMGIVIAHKSVPLPTVLEQLWEAEKDRAKKIPDKDGFCFRVVYGSGNTLEALMKGILLPAWCNLLTKVGTNEDFSPLLYRLSEELPRRCTVTENLHLFRAAAQVILNRRDQSKQLAEDDQKKFLNWIDAWEKWAYRINPRSDKSVLGAQPEDLGNLLRFTAFWVDRMSERNQWVKGGEK